ncbi:hypothetical protein EDEG_03060 [Edhazardia aedis USNM 41457]|uniref:Transcriptional adapter 2-alpha/beta-like domain-containing protein n=1 Tax=Edhazardia aedis (strain USNM 41457) TaxID=1003232 RepID=J8ZSD5_EDHAE|nr:hypothetical protein EDEG_03060 [Edhazardia aedis USNM 41457]|eukprot:EJW02548.1 hypothetical protein EDEG_03060 [Edhazardia aedis USNM 41457]
MALSVLKDQNRFFILCDICFTEITKTTHAKCYDCKLDICIFCFKNNSAINFQKHTQQHSYNVIHPMVSDTKWSLFDEIIFYDAVLVYGIGNWKGMSDFYRSKSQDDIKTLFYNLFGIHQEKIDKRRKEFKDYGTKETKDTKDINIKDTNININTNTSNSADTNINITDINNNINKNTNISKITDTDTTKKRKIDTEPMYSNPNRHEISTYMPLRKDFEIEFENELENTIKEIHNDPIFTEKQNNHLKQVLFECYNNTIKSRNFKKFILLEKNLINYKETLTNEEKIKQNESYKKILDKVKPLASIISKKDFNEFFKGLCIEEFLYKKISNFAKDFTNDNYDLIEFEKKRAHLLSDPEKMLCAKIKINFKEYLKVKERIIYLNAKFGCIDCRKMKAVLKSNDDRIEELFYFFVNNKWINEPSTQ